MHYLNYFELNQIDKMSFIATVLADYDGIPEDLTECVKMVEDEIRDKVLIPLTDGLNGGYDHVWSCNTIIDAHQFGLKFYNIPAAVCDSAWENFLGDCEEVLEINEGLFLIKCDGMYSVEEPYMIFQYASDNAFANSDRTELDAKYWEGQALYMASKYLKEKQNGR